MGELLPGGDDLSLLGLVLLGALYGYVLLKAAVHIGEGSEELLSIYGPGIIGGLAIPILGAVPDGMIILFSGISGGSKEEQLETLKIGLGTLAGSTICLLTIPWAFVILLGWTDYDPVTGEAAKKQLMNGSTVPKHDGPFSLTKSCVTVGKYTAHSVYVMLFTCIPYFVIQIPAFIYENLSEDDQAKHEHVPAMVGIICAVIAMLAYAVYVLKSSAAQELISRRQQEAKLSTWQNTFSKKFSQFDNVLAEAFQLMDRDDSGHVDIQELHHGIKVMGFPDVSTHVKDIFESLDADGNGEVTFEEFETGIKKWLQTDHDDSKEETVGESAGGTDTNTRVAWTAKPGPAGGNVQGGGTQSLQTLSQPLVGKGEGGSQDEGVVIADLREQFGSREEEAQDWKPVEEPTKGAVLRKAGYHLFIGVALVLIFSDPMIGVLENFAKKIHIPAFYVSFTLSPLAANASEIVSVLIFARSKASNKISMGISSLYGAAIMNNTFCLAIFLVLIYVNELPWEFSAETIAIILVQVAIVIIGRTKTLMAWKAVAALLLYPLSLAFVIVWHLVDDAKSS